MNLNCVGIEVREDYYNMALNAIPKLVELEIDILGERNKKITLKNYIRF